MTWFIALRLLFLHFLLPHHCCSFQLPVSLDGVLTHFELQHCNTLNALQQSVREFCFLHRIKTNDCQTMMGAAEQKSKNIPCPQKQGDDPIPAENTRMFRWKSTTSTTQSEDAVDDIYVQLVSATALNHLSPTTMQQLALQYNAKHAVPNQFGRTSKAWSFVLNSTEFALKEKESKGKSFLFDDILSFENTHLHIVVPNQPGSAIPWFHPPPRSTLVLLFDGSNVATETIEQYLQRCSDLLQLLQYHRHSIHAMEIGLIILGNNLRRRRNFCRGCYNLLTVLFFKFEF